MNAFDWLPFLGYFIYAISIFFSYLFKKKETLSNKILGQIALVKRVNYLLQIDRSRETKK